MKIILRLLLRVLYRFRAYGTDSLDCPGPVLLAPNHVSWLDWLFLGVVLGDEWKFVTSSTTAHASWLHRKIMNNRRTFPVDPTSAYAVRDMTEFLQQGGKLVLFPEGRISTTGNLMKVYEGTGFLIHKTGARVVTCYLRGTERLPWVKHPGWTRWFPRACVHFSAPSNPPSFPNVSGSTARHQTSAWLRDLLVKQQFDVAMQFGADTIPAAVAETAANIPNRVAFEDINNAPLTYRRMVIGSDVLSDIWRTRLGPQPGEAIGVLLPNVNAAPIVLLSLWSIGKTPTILNFSTGTPVMLICAQLAGLQHIITSRAFLEKAKLDLAPLEAAGITLLYLEEIRAEATWTSKFRAVLRNRFAPARRLRRAPVKAEQTAVILFTSGSEGIPKGVQLSHRNLVANVRQVISSLDLTDQDRLFNALPLFHSFGLVGGALFPLIRGCYTFLYPSPLHYRIVPTLVYEKNCTVLMGTNTFLNGYARKAHPYDFNTLRYLVAGAEKVQSSTFETWARKYGVRILEGYGATECSPVISVNNRIENRFGTAGRFLPGIEYRLESVEGVEDAGRLFVRGPNVMKGYLNPEADAKFQALNGWYDTGDIVHVDEQGFVHIRGRLKRFAKISGEMVSLTAVEDALAGAFPLYGLRCQVAVIARPDADKGEKLIAVTNEARLQLADLRAAIRATGLSNLCAPRELRFVPSIPKLGTGKVNHRELESLLDFSETAPAPAIAQSTAH